MTSTLPDPLDINEHVEAKHYTAWLDGQHVKYAYAASVSQGWVDRFVEDEKGGIAIKDHAPVRARLHGRVELRRKPEGGE